MLLQQFFSKSRECYKPQWIKRASQKVKGSRFRLEGTTCGDWFFNRNISAKFCTWTEVDKLDLGDIIEMHEILDIQEDQEAYQYLNRKE